MLDIEASTGYVDKFDIGHIFHALKATKATDLAFPSFKEAMSGPHRSEFLQAMSKEGKQLMEHKTWHSKAYLRKHLPSKAQIIPLTWIFKIKSDPMLTSISLKLVYVIEVIWICINLLLILQWQNGHLLELS